MGTPARWLHDRVGFPAPQPYSGPVSLKNLHPELKLGLVLVVAAALLTFAAPGPLAASLAVRQLDPYADSHGWLLLAASIGGLAVVAAVFWVDRKPPHTMMAAGAVVAALGLAAAGLSQSLAFAVLGTFVAGFGGAAVGSLIFYSIAVKGASRYRGRLIGALVMVFTLRLNITQVTDWTSAPSTLALSISVAASLIGAAVLLFLLPRMFAGPNQDGPTLKETLVQPTFRRNAAWLTAAFLVSTMTTAVAGFNLPALVDSLFSFRDYDRFQALNLPPLAGVCAFFWGVAADIYPPRRLFLFSALALFPTIASLWAFVGLPALVFWQFGFWIVQGGLICLPWVLMAELVTPRHFAKVALVIAFLGGTLGGTLGGAIGPIMRFYFDFVWGDGVVLVFILALASALTAVAILAPKPQAAGIKACSN